MVFFFEEEYQGNDALWGVRLRLRGVMLGSGCIRFRPKVRAPHMSAGFARSFCISRRRRARNARRRPGLHCWRWIPRGGIAPGWPPGRGRGSRGRILSSSGGARMITPSPTCAVFVDVETQGRASQRALTSRGQGDRALKDRIRPDILPFDEQRAD